MKTYIVYVEGEEQKGYIKAASQNAALKKAQTKFPNKNVDVVYTEI